MSMESGWKPVMGQMLAAISILLVVGGFIFMNVYAVHAHWQQHVLHTRGVATKGTVVKMDSYYQSDEGDGGGGGMVYKIHYRFTVPNGSAGSSAAKVFTTVTQARKSRYYRVSKGETLPIRYDPDEPRLSEIVGWGGTDANRWWTIAIAIDALLLGIGFIAWLGFRGGALGVSTSVIVGVLFLGYLVWVHISAGLPGFLALVALDALALLLAWWATSRCRRALARLTIPPGRRDLRVGVLFFDCAVIALLATMPFAMALGDWATHVGLFHYGERTTAHVVSTDCFGDHHSAPITSSMAMSPIRSSRHRAPWHPRAACPSRLRA